MAEPNPALGDPALRRYYGRARGPVAFIDESYRAPSPAEPVGLYMVVGSVVDRDNMIDVRRALLRVTGGRPWHTTEAHREAPAMIGRMTTAIATEAYNNTLVVSTPWTEGSAARHRAEALGTLLRDLSRMGARLVVMDGLEPVAQERDRKTVNTLRANGGVHPETLVVHGDDSVESLLWVPDTVGWSVGRLLTRDEADWSAELEDVVAVKESERGGWVDLSAVRAAAGERAARAELERQVATIRGAAFTDRTAAPRSPATRAAVRRPGQGQQHEGPAR